MKRKRLAVVGLLTVGAALVVAPPEPTTAAWTLPQGARGTFTAGTVMPPTSLTCSGGLFKNATFSWGAPTEGLLPVSGYEWTLTPQGGSPSGPNTTTDTSAPMPPEILNAGTSTFSLVAVGPGGWKSAAVQQTIYRLAAVGLPVYSSCTT
ncbi:hypothetical protein [Arthrobacter globiformis]|uniref:hypothetical protein n=1 Tax=Arthrobacter globiformis TaxID=1665 RepID=UPI002789C713|nr:hypothetical protein [Arthrobacter globiformis]MDQ0866448.1 hypothetical protein [Arthrobacter globiformis]